MEILVPPLLKAIHEVRWMIGTGRSMKDSFRNYLDAGNDSLASELRERWTLKWQASPRDELPRPFKSHYQKSFWDLIERGCAGPFDARPASAGHGCARFVPPETTALDAVKTTVPAAPSTSANITSAPPSIT